MGKLGNRLRSGNFSKRPLPLQKENQQDESSQLPVKNPALQPQQQPQFVEEDYPEEQQQFEEEEFGTQQPYQVPIPPPPSPQQVQDYQDYTKRQREVEEERFQNNPMAILDEIKKAPSPKGTHPIIIGGRPIDLHMLEDYVIRTSPYSLKTIMRYHNARTIEEIKGYAKGFGGKGINGRTILLIMLAIGMAVIGIMVIFFMPQIMEFFQGGIM
jgi:hypothetical protein